MKPSRPAAARWAATLLLASAGSLAHAHGNIRLPWWTGLAVGLYLTLPLPLLVAAIGAVRDRKAPLAAHRRPAVARWVRCFST
jgi:hypothetical protein